MTFFIQQLRPRGGATVFWGLTSCISLSSVYQAIGINPRVKDHAVGSCPGANVIRLDMLVQIFSIKSVYALDLKKEKERRENERE